MPNHAGRPRVVVVVGGGMVVVVGGMVVVVVVDGVVDVVVPTVEVVNPTVVGVAAGAHDMSSRVIKVAIHRTTSSQTGDGRYVINVE